MIAALVAFAYMHLKGTKLEHFNKNVAWSFLKLSVLACMASPFGYAALKHIDYPTLILGKSCKLVPVVLMNFLIYRKTFPLKKYLIVFLITVGVSSFMLLDPKKKQSKQSSSWYGLFLLSINLILDGTINSTQDQMFKKHKLQGTSMMFFMNSFSFVLMLLFLMVNPFSNELTDAIVFCSTHPAIVYDILLFSLAGALGQCFIFMTLEHFGSLILVTVTVTRKMFSIILSVLWFGHQLSVGQWGSVALVFIAIAWEATGKAGAKKHSQEEIHLDNVDKKKRNSKKID
jgi:UDP-galactose transporter B1